MSVLRVIDRMAVDAPSPSPVVEIAGPLRITDLARYLRCSRTTVYRALRELGCDENDRMVNGSLSPEIVAALLGMRRAMQPCRNPRGRGMCDSRRGGVSPGNKNAQ